MYLTIAQSHILAARVIYKSKGKVLSIKSLIEDTRHLSDYFFARFHLILEEAIRSLETLPRPTL